MRTIKLFCLLTMLTFTVTLSAQDPTEDLDVKYAATLLTPGSDMPDFTLKTPEGKSVRLSKLTKGHYAVIDFWASWCPDCRKDQPNIIHMYQDFAPSGVQFVGISHDTDAKAWKNAIEKYNVEYPQLSELKKMADSDVAKAFGVKWIPSMMLIGPDGKVILATVMSEKIRAKLEELTK